MPESTREGFEKLAGEVGDSLRVLTPAFVSGYQRQMHDAGRFSNLQTNKQTNKQTPKPKPNQTKTKTKKHSCSCV